MAKNITPAPISRQECVAMIDSLGLRAEFSDLVGDERTPEEYLAEYGHLEPELWQNLLNDLCGLAVVGKNP